MKILVTGGAGFIGSQIVDRLLEVGHEVVVVDNLTTGNRRNLNPNATFYEMSVLDSQLAEVFDREKPDIVNHHAAQIDVRKAVADPLYDAQQNIIASIRLIELARTHGVQKIIYASTGGAIYGEPIYLPADEDHPVRPLSPYGISKHTVEHYLDLALLNFGLVYTVLRYANVYGPRQDPHGEAGVVAIFSESMLQGKRPTIFGDGSSTRDYIFIDDVVQANLLAMDGGNGQIYNVGTSQQTSLNVLFNEMKAAVGVEMDAVFAPARLGEVDKIALTNDKIKRDLGWVPAHTLAEGLAKTIRYYRSLE
ncbi:MAG: NAD-dependent epimerase/dehydratase family protein [Candidatus Poribacteria bacterium]|nr:NAD-dependent epimerase/dehydratase family protein [Candidatus Poribacteria bacterium]